ncbi:MAG: GGDEF domain-containing phosphodiesterase, partial [Pseudomonadota bacterium]
MGGDEFLAAVARPRGDPSPRALAERMLAFARRPLSLDEDVVRFGMSIGIARQPLEAFDLDALQVEADLAMYQAKRGGKNQIHEYDSELRSRAVRNKTLSDELRCAVERDEFAPFFQTQHDARTGAVVGAEALVRWRHPERGVLTPDRFLPVAEKIGIVKHIDLTVMRRAAEAARRLEEKGLILPKLNVNVSLPRLRDPDLAASIASLPLSATALSFEILEAVFLDEFDDLTRFQFDRLREMGVTLEIDDFGTGRTSIVALTRLEPDRIKIDRELARDVATDATQRRIVQSIVDMAASLKVGTTVEGVETRAQAEVLADLGVGALQGFLFGEPCDEAELERRLRGLAAA